MNIFFSLLSSGDGVIYCFSPAQRIAGVKMPNGGKCNFDSHASIARFYGLDENECNTWAYNPFDGKLVLDMQPAADDRDAVLEELKKIDFSLICGNIEGAREFIRHLKTMKFLDGHGDAPDDVKMFETREEASDAVRNVATDAERVAAWQNAEAAAWDAAGCVAWDGAMDAASDAAWDAVWSAATVAVEDAILFAQLIYVCFGLPVDQKHIDHIKKRWNVWEAGFGVYCGFDGVLYCYKHA